MTEMSIEDMELTRSGKTTVDQGTPDHSRTKPRGRDERKGDHQSRVGARLLAQATSFWKCARKHTKETHRVVEGKETPQGF